jgi:glucokinase
MMQDMYLGIEIGGTKLQLGVGDGTGGELAALIRRDVDRQRGARGILEEIQRSAPDLMRQHSIERIGVGFGGPVNTATGVATKSHQVEGWDNFPLAAWCQDKLGAPTIIGNDCDVAALAEAKYGAGRGAGSVFYVTVGTGIGGGLVLGGKLHGAGRPAAAEIGHLRPGLHCDRPEMTVESLASGPAIAAAASASTGASAPAELTARMVAQAAAAGNSNAHTVLLNAVQALGWAIAQVVTLVAPEVVVVGGGVSLMGEDLFFKPLRAAVQKYVFPSLADSYGIVPAGLAELAVVHGAIALAAGE